MGLNIPSNVPTSAVVDFRQQDLVTPTSAPTVIENIQAVDPRVALNLPMPVSPSGDGASLGDILHSNLQNNAAILELSNLEENIANGGGPVLAQSLTKMDSLGSIALGQLLSQLLIEDQAGIVDSKLAVKWPMPQNAQEASPLPADLRGAMNILLKNLENSGLFAADQLKKIMMPALQTSQDQETHYQSIVEEAKTFLKQLTNENTALKDSVRLLLRGDLVWQGELLPNIQAKIYRSDAWESDLEKSSETQKGSRLSVEIMLPNLGTFEVSGTQFGGQINIGMKTKDTSKILLSTQIGELIKQLKESVDAQVNIGFICN